MLLRSRQQASRCSRRALVLLGAHMLAAFLHAARASSCLRRESDHLCVWVLTVVSHLHSAPYLPVQVPGAQAQHQAAQLPQPLQLVAWEAPELAAATRAAQLTLAARPLAAQAPAHLAAAMVPLQALAVTAPPCGMAATAARAPQVG